MISIKNVIVYTYNTFVKHEKNQQKNVKNKRSPIHLGWRMHKGEPVES